MTVDQRAADHAGLARDAVLVPPAALGVIGSGQLGRMFIQAAQRMGYQAGVLSATAETPAAQAANWTVIGPPDHLPALKSFAAQAQAITVEFENVSAPALRGSSAARAPGAPGWRTLWVAQNRLREKRFLERHGIPLAPWRPVRNESELDDAVAALGLPLILKTAASGYDGKGQVLLKSASEARAAWASLGRVPCVAEGWVEFAAEVSMVVARGADGQAVCLSGRAQPPRAPHPRFDPHAGRCRSRGGPGVPGSGSRDRPGARDRRRFDGRILLEERWSTPGQRDGSAPP